MRLNDRRLFHLNKRYKNRIVFYSGGMKDGRKFKVLKVIQHKEMFIFVLKPIFFSWFRKKKNIATLIHEVCRYYCISIYRIQFNSYPTFFYDGETRLKLPRGTVAANNQYTHII